jgi:hypothetical protein
MVDIFTIFCLLVYVSKVLISIIESLKVCKNALLANFQD